MTHWKAFKWLAHLGWAAPGWILIWIITEIVGADAIPPSFLPLLEFVTEHRASMATGTIAWPILWGAVWLRLDFSEQLHELTKQVPLFIHSEDLEPHHFDLTGYDEFYLEKQEYGRAKQLLEDKGRILILGRPMGGKTRMAYQLAKEQKGAWILRTRPEFTDFDKLIFPYFPWLYSLNILWLVDDLEKHVGHTRLDWRERTLRRYSNLRLILTCRKGDELETVKSDKETAAFVERLSTVSCADLTDEELLRLAENTGKPKDLDLYDGSAGSVTLGLQSMSERLRAGPGEAKSVMRAMFLLRHVGIYDPQTAIAQETTARIFGIQFVGISFTKVVEWLIRNGYLKLGNPRLTPAHDAYLTREFLPYYRERDASLNQDTALLTSLIMKSADWSALSSIATSLHLARNLDGAIAAYRLSLEQCPANPDICYNLALALDDQDDTAQAISFYRRALELEPAFAEAAHNLANTLMRDGQLDEAIALHKKNLKQGPDVSETLYNLGIAYDRKGEVELAIKSYREALSKRPNYPMASNNLAIIMSSQGRHEQAIELYMQALSMDPYEPKLHYNLGHALRDADLIDESISAYRSAVHWKPNYHMAHRSLAMSLAEHGQQEEAIDYLRKVCAAHPGEAETLSDLGHILTQDGQPDEAINFLRKAIGIAPDLAVAHINLGVALAALRKPGDAIFHFEKAIGLAPDDAAPYLNIGVTLAQGNNFEDAIPYFKKTAELRPDSAKAYYDLGFVLHKAGKKGEAAEMFGKAKELDPTLEPPEEQNDEDDS